LIFKLGVSGTIRKPNNTNFRAKPSMELEIQQENVVLLHFANYMSDF
jgi:hypothetical protein